MHASTIICTDGVLNVICCQHFQGLFAFLGLSLEVISFGYDVTSGKQNCVEFGVVCWIHGFNAGMFLEEKTTAPIWQSITTRVIFENGSDSQGIRGRWKTSLSSVNKDLFLGWLEVFCFALSGQSFCSSKLLFLFQSSWRIDTLFWVFPDEQKLFHLFLFHLIELVI